MAVEVGAGIAQQTAGGITPTPCGVISPRRLCHFLSCLSEKARSGHHDAAETEHYTLQSSSAFDGVVDSRIADAAKSCGTTKCYQYNADELTQPKTLLF
jgi:hypothetical protein